MKNIKLINILLILLFILSVGIAHATTINSVTVSEPDMFYSPAEGNNVIHIVANVTALTGNPSEVVIAISLISLL